MEEIELLEVLEKNGLSEIEEIKSDDTCKVFKFCYDFQNDELKAARAYSNSESNVTEDSAEWYENWYTPYLYDIAKDNIQEVIEEICEEYEIEGEFKEVEEYNMSIEFMKGFIMFCTDSSSIDIDEMINGYI